MMDFVIYQVDETFDSEHLFTGEFKGETRVRACVRGLQANLIMIPTSIF